MIRSAVQRSGRILAASQTRWRSGAAGIAQRRCLLEPLVVVALSASIFACAAVVLGADASWDTQNYHLYNPYAWLHDRLDVDAQPAMRQTYFNPLLDVLFYLLNRALPAIWASALWGAAQGLLLVMLYGLARVLLAELSRQRAISVAAVVALIGAASPFNVSQLGRFTGDNTSGIFLLAALLCCTLAVRRCGERDAVRDTGRWFAVGGVLAGLGFGLKLTNGPYALALPLALLVLPLATRVKTNAVGLYAIGGLTGAVVSAGPWWWRLWSTTDNPLYPQFNHVFRSPWIHPLPFMDGGYRGVSWIDTLLYPAYYNEFLTGRKIAWHSFGDVRLPLLLAIGVAVLIMLAWRRMRLGEQRAQTGELLPHVFVLGFALMAYALWILVFSIARYTLVLEVLTPIAVYAGLRLLPLAARARWSLTAVALLFVVVSHRSLDGDRIPFGETLFDVRPPADVELEHALVVIAGEAPVAFVIASLPASARFVRTGGNIFYPGGYDDIAGRYANRTGDALVAAIREHTGPRYVMTTVHELDHVGPELAHFGLRFDAARARPIHTRVGSHIVLVQAELSR